MGTKDVVRMKERLDAIRKPEKVQGKKAAAATAGILAFGIALGIFSKWLDNIAFDSAIWWHRPIEALRLNAFFSDMAIWLLAALVIAVFSRSALRAAVNVFAFFAGMCAAYHLHSILFSGFDPSSYMMIWYGITLLSPFLAVLCWYAKGKGVVAVLLDIGIMAVFTLACFAIGFFYVDLRGILYLLVYIGAAAAIYRSPKQLLLSMLAGFLLAFPLDPLWPFH